MVPLPLLHRACSWEVVGILLAGVPVNEYPVLIFNASRPEDTHE